MKLGEFKQQVAEEATSPPPPRISEVRHPIREYPGTTVFMPAVASTPAHVSESITLASGFCPACDEKLKSVEIVRGKVFYQCQNYYHFYVRDAMM